MEEENYFHGLELLFNLCQGSLVSKEDCLVAATHIFLINKGNKCVGIGDEWESNSPSELLPQNWNSNQELYTLRYISRSNKTKYLMKIVKAGNTLLINLVNVNEEKAAGMSVNVDNHVSGDFKEYASAFKHLEQFGKTLQQEIVQKVHPKSEDEAGASKDEQARSQETLPDDLGPYIREGYVLPSSLRAAPPRGVAFPSVGRADLDPLAGGYGGGMLFDPSGMMRPPGPNLGIGGPRLPRGAVPPHARFDPFGPPAGGGRFGPDPDHMPAPGFDDAFM